VTGSELSGLATLGWRIEIGGDCGVGGKVWNYSSNDYCIGLLSKLRRFLRSCGGNSHGF